MKVYLIGAGPGDPGLLTLKGKTVLETADIIVYDYLACDGLLEYARPDAEKIYVGKIADNHAMKQTDINALLIRKAKEGKTVARLKGGDPYIFGRGGEEALELLNAGVPFEEIPGVTSAIAGPAYAGIPLTHRAYASSVTIITGHEDPTKPESAMNWPALAASASTLVFVMGMKNLPGISSNLIKGGLSADTPAALVMWATTPKHRSVLTTLGGLPEAAERGGFANPCLIVVGAAAALHDRLNWFERRPLLGKTIVVTRAREQASGLAFILSELGADVIQFPTIAIKPLDVMLPELSAYDWVVFTSANGVRCVTQTLAKSGKDARSFAGCKVAAIGPATADAVRMFGILPDFVPENYIAEDIAKGLIACGVKGRRVLIPRAAKAREILPEELRRAGADVTILPVYETIPDTGNRDAVLNHLNAGTLDAITFGSSSTVTNFLAQIPAETLKAHPKVVLAAIGPVTAATLEENGLRAAIQPTAYTIPALVEALTAYYADRN